MESCIDYEIFWHEKIDMPSKDNKDAIKNSFIKLIKSFIILQGEFTFSKNCLGLWG